MIWLSLIGLFIVIAVDNSKETKKQIFTENEIEYLQSVGLINEEEIQKYRNNKQII
jgi:hypothetical protein